MSVPARYMAGSLRRSPQALAVATVAVVAGLVAGWAWMSVASLELRRAMLLYAEVPLAVALWYELQPREARAFFARFDVRVGLTVALHVAAFVIIARWVPVSWTSGATRWLNDGIAYQSGQVPYRDYLLEYPPLAAPLLSFPAVFSHSLDGYRIGFGVMMLLFDLATAVTCLWTIRRLAPAVLPWGVIVLQPLWLVIAGRNLVLEDFDLAPTALAVLAVVLFVSGSRRGGWVALGLGTALKLFPVVLAPIFLLIALSERERDPLLGDINAFVLAMLIPSSVVVRGQLAAIWTFVSYHLQRGLEIESSYAAALMVVHAVSGYAIRDVSAFGSEELHASLAVPLGTLSSGLTVLALCALYVTAWRRRRQLFAPDQVFESTVRLALAAFLLFMLAGKVLSPQYLLWVYPLVVLLSQRQAPAVWVVYSAILLLGNWIYPTHWSDMTQFTPQAVAVLVTRNVLLAALTLLVLQGLGQPCTSAARITAETAPVPAEVPTTPAV